MSRRRNVGVHPRDRFPRVSGDEPQQVSTSLGDVGFSPRERG